MSQKMEMVDMPFPQPASVAFDTHRFVKNLMGYGFTEKQAEGLAEEQVKLLNSNLVTNERLAETEACLKADLAKAEARLEVKIAETESHLVKWMFGMTIGMVSMFVALFAMLIRLLM